MTFILPQAHLDISGMAVTFEEVNDDWHYTVSAADGADVENEPWIEQSGFESYQAAKEHFCRACDLDPDDLELHA